MHSAKAKWCRRFWGYVGVFVLDLVLNVCTGISGFNSILKFVYMYIVF